MAEPGRAACICNDDREFVTTERWALVSWHLAHGDALSTTQIAELVGIGRQAAWEGMQKLSRVIPVLCFDGEWMPAVMAEALYVDDLPNCETM